MRCPSLKIIRCEEGGGVTRRAARGLHKALPAFRAALLARQNFKSLRVTVTRDSGGGGGDESALSLLVSEERYTRGYNCLSSREPRPSYLVFYRTFRFFRSVCGRSWRRFGRDRSGLIIRSTPESFV